jgi:uncharacterized protein (DUF2235 family)
MTGSGRNLIVLSDGTGNSASKSSKTNVWRLYQAIDLTDGMQIAEFGDGVGTSSVKLLRILGLALGIGVKRNVLNLYKFLCRNHRVGDKIWAFGFSRGAFTIRVLVGLINREGLVSWETEAELDRNALAAYRAYRKHAFKLNPWLPWVSVLRSIRDMIVWAWNEVSDRKQYSKIAKTSVKIHFVGVWDTVAAYGLPIAELTRAVNDWVWPLTFAQRNLPETVDNARHALSLDDERETFHPNLWDETWEKHLVSVGRVPPGRLKQVWFAGSHADVGGGYPDDGLSFVALGWMIDEAKDKELRFMPSIVADFAALATPTGRIYDSRSGFGAFYRYQPRDAQVLLNATDLPVPSGTSITPVVYGSVITRIVCGPEDYAPISLPEKIEVLPPYGPPVAFVDSKVREALKLATPSGKDLSTEDLKKHRLVLEHTLTAVTHATQVPLRSARFELVRDTVWWRRVNYFVSLFFFLIAAAFPLVVAYLPGVTADVATGGTVRWLATTSGAFLPSFVAPWINAVCLRPVVAASVLIGLFVNLGLSATLQQRIWDRARAAWIVDPAKKPLLPTGQRGALFGTALCLAVFAVAAWVLKCDPSDPRCDPRSGTLWSMSFASVAAIFGTLWFFRRYIRRPVPMNPANPGFLVSLTRKLRTARWSTLTYTITAQYALPAIFLILAGVAVLSLGHRVVFDLASAAGEYCISDMRDPGEETLVGEKTFATKSKCNPTGFRLIEGRKYRIQIDMDKGADGEWFDNGVRTDVAGFGTDSLRLVTASPLKRWWFENWFQPVARIGKIGNYEHVLRPAAPLTAMKHLSDIELKEEDRKDFKKNCSFPPEKWDWETDISLPADKDFRDRELNCERTYKITPNRRLISDITADATGELFIYVNDAVLAFPGWTDLFYQNDRGTATVTVTPILADSIESPTEGK